MDLSSVDINLLGKTHTNFLNNYHNKTLKKSFGNEIEGFDKEVMGEFLVNKLAEIEEYNYDITHLDNNLSKKSNEFLSDLMLSVDDFTNVSEFEIVITDIKQNVENSGISNFEKQVVLGTIEITKNSTIFYAPKELGGLQSNGLILNYQAKGWSWSRAAKGAAAGSMIFFLGIGLAVVAPPVGLAVLSGWAWAAAAGTVVGGAGLVSKTQKYDKKETNLLFYR